MNLATNDGDFRYETKEEIAEHIRKSASLGMDDIWISGEEEYPCMAVLVNKEFACINYFENGNGDMWITYSENEREVIFLAGGEEWTAPADTVISLESALLCMEEFFDTLKRPQCVKWQEL